jgi:predicted DNA-binding antitoxin AbrB/MazE fold protein
MRAFALHDMPCYRWRMEVIEAEFNDGVLRPMRHLPLRPGERVGLVVVRRPDLSRWDLARLSKLVADEETLTEAGLGEWETALRNEDRS